MVAGAVFAGSRPLRNERRERFVRALVAGRSRIEAYQEAGYRSSARQAPDRLMRRPDVAARLLYLRGRAAAVAIREREASRALVLRDGAQRLAEVQEAAEAAVIQAAAVIREAALIGGSNPNDYEWGDDGRLRTVEGVSPDALRAVSSVKRRVRRIVRDDGAIEEVEHQEFKLWNKPEALRMLGQNLRLWLQEQLGVVLGARVEVVLVDEGRDRRVEAAVEAVEADE